MSSDTDSNLRTRAIEWHVRLRDGDDATWDAFTDWLGKDSRHREAYEAIEQIDEAIEPLLPHVTFQNATRETDRSATSPVVPTRRRWWIAGAALAASIAAVVVSLPLLSSSRYEVLTGPGQRQTVALDDATQVILNGSTKITFDRKNPRYASLASGEALFLVHHDDARPFTLEVGKHRIEDVGTIFNVVRDSSQVRVAVAEGAVVYRKQRQEISLGAGQALLVRGDSTDDQVTTLPVESIGAWQKDRLVYSGEPLSLVAADLGRALGIQIEVSPAIMNRPFYGVIALHGSGPEQPKRLSQALNVDLKPGPAGWTMQPLDDVGH
jgi:transmembrane sensor